MRFTVPVSLIFLALAVTACGGGPTSVLTSATKAPVDTQLASTSTPAAVVPTETPTGPLGSVSGSIIQPPAAQPATALRVYAREKSTARVFSIEIPVDSTTYTLSNLPMGTYSVFAWFYPDGAPGAYTSSKIVFATTSSDQLKCSNSLLEIVLTPENRDFQGADIGCWAGNFFVYLTPMP